MLAHTVFLDSLAAVKPCQRGGGALLELASCTCRAPGPRLFFHGCAKGCDTGQTFRPGPSTGYFSKDARHEASGFSRYPILGAPGLPIGSVRGGRIPSHEKSLFSVTPVDPHRKGWSIGQLNLILFCRRDPRTATESKPESRAKPRRWRVTLSRGVRGTFWELPMAAPTPTPPLGASFPPKESHPLTPVCHCSLFLSGFEFWKHPEGIWS